MEDEKQERWLEENTIHKEYLRKKVQELSEIIRDCNANDDAESAFYYQSLKDVLRDLLNKKGLFKDA